MIHRMVTSDTEYDKLTNEERREIRRSLFSWFATLKMEDQFEEEEGEGDALLSG